MTTTAPSYAASPAPGRDPVVPGDYDWRSLHGARLRIGRSAVGRPGYTGSPIRWASPVWERRVEDGMVSTVRTCRKPRHS